MKGGGDEPFFLLLSLFSLVGTTPRREKANLRGAFFFFFPEKILQLFLSLRERVSSLSPSLFFYSRSGIPTSARAIALSRCRRRETASHDHRDSRRWHDDEPRRRSSTKAASPARFLRTAAVAAGINEPHASPSAATAA